MSTTANSRVLTPLPSKAYLVLYLILGKGEQARRRINDLARGLLLKHLVDNLQAQHFLSPEEIECLQPFWEAEDIQVDYSESDWEALAKEFEQWGYNPDGEVEPKNYIVGTIRDLLAL